MPKPFAHDLPFGRKPTQGEARSRSFEAALQGVRLSICRASSATAPALMRSSSATPLHSIDFIGSWRRELRFDSKARLSPGAVIGRERPDPLDILARFRALALMFGMPVAPAIDEFELAGGRRRRAAVRKSSTTMQRSTSAIGLRHSTRRESNRA
jgi:hypothetical protein